ncbi:hypothetical protein BD414DRAFT_541140 [Trametes punicea]|nr:hypothetical protein BD414DRAFT_541140 [Trametes punicea]
MSSYMAHLFMSPTWTLVRLISPVIKTVQEQAIPLTCVRIAGNPLAKQQLTLVATFNVCCLMPLEDLESISQSLDASVVTASIVGVVLSSLTFGAHLTLFLLLLRAYRHSAKKAYDGLSRRDWLLLLYLCVLFFLATIGLCLHIWIQHDAFILHSNVPGGPTAYLTQNKGSAANVAMTMMYIALNWCADGLLIYRVYALFKYSKVAVLGCIAALLTLIVVGSVFLKDISMISIDLWTHVERGPSLAYLSLSFATNVALTCVVVVRLLVLRARITECIYPRYPDIYSSLAAMLVGSAALYTGVTLIAIVVCAVRSPLQNALLPMLCQLQAIPSLLITLRVMEGRAVVAETWTTTLSFAAERTATPFRSVKLDIPDRDLSYASPNCPPSYHEGEHESYGSMRLPMGKDLYTAWSTPRASPFGAKRGQLHLNRDLSRFADWKTSEDEEYAMPWDTSLSLPQYPSEAHTLDCTTYAGPLPVGGVMLQLHQQASASG